MKEAGVIQRIEGEEIFLSCHSDAACKSCGASSFCKTQGREIIARNRRRLSLHEGDQVEFFLPPGRTIFSGFIVLIFPLLTFIAGFLMADRLLPDSGEGLKALFGLAGLGAGFAASYIYNYINKEKNYPEVIKKI
ncbi:MAG TPA: Fis family transcriptional regulator [Sediminispirochaeta sp.]|nr:Fis family transcriptional regulator [Sediminispirochaeta sp.]